MKKSFSSSRSVDSIRGLSQNRGDLVEFRTFNSKRNIYTCVSGLRLLFWISRKDPHTEHVLSDLHGTWNQTVTIRDSRSPVTLTKTLTFCGVGWMPRQIGLRILILADPTRDIFSWWIAASSLGKVSVKTTCHFPLLRLNLLQLAKQAKKRLGSTCVKRQLILDFPKLSSKANPKSHLSRAKTKATPKSHSSMRRQRCLPRRCYAQKSCAPKVLSSYRYSKFVSALCVNSCAIFSWFFQSFAYLIFPPMFTSLVRRFAHWHYLSLEDPTIVGESDKAPTNKICRRAPLAWP